MRSNSPRISSMSSHSHRKYRSVNVDNLQNSSCVSPRISFTKSENSTSFERRSRFTSPAFVAQENAHAKLMTEFLGQVINKNYRKPTNILTKSNSENRLNGQKRGQRNVFGRSEGGKTPKTLKSEVSFDDMGDVSPTDTRSAVKNIERCLKQTSNRGSCLKNCAMSCSVQNNNLNASSSNVKKAVKTNPKQMKNQQNIKHQDLLDRHRKMDVISEEDSDIITPESEENLSYSSSQKNMQESCAGFLSIMHDTVLDTVEVIGNHNYKGCFFEKFNSNQKYTAQRFQYCQLHVL